jgi:porin
MELGHGVSVELAARAIGQQGLFQGRSDAAGGAALLDVAPQWRPTDHDTLFVWTRFAAGNGLNVITPTRLPPYGGDLAEDVRGIDDTDRSYLMEAWYRRRIAKEHLGEFHLTAGIVDIARFIDDNQYANDQEAQFMNAAFVNVAKNVLPNYEPAVVAQWDAGPWSLRLAGVFGSLDNTAHLDYGAGELVYALPTRWGTGHYRLLGFLSGPGHPAPGGHSHDRRIEAVAVNLDQPLPGGIGVFFRGSMQAERGNAVYRAMASGGLVLAGSAWGRADDRIGLAYAWLDGMAHEDLTETHAVELFWQWQLGEALDVTVDLQWLHDAYGGGEDVTAWIPGVRANLVF